MEVNPDGCCLALVDVTPSKEPHQNRVADPQLLGKAIFPEALLKLVGNYGSPQAMSALAIQKRVRRG